MKKQRQKQLIPKLKLISRGKVWEQYHLPGYPDLMLKVATNNISTHNEVHKSQIPMKGQVLVAMSIMFAEEIFDSIGVKTHLVAYGKGMMQYIEPDLFLDDVDAYHDFIKSSMIVKKLDMIPYEFIFRGHMTGSLWTKFVSKGIENPYGLEFSKDIELMSPLSPAIFTPTEKSETDDPVNSKKIEKLYHEAVEISRKVYKAARKFTSLFGIDIIDTKFEFGIDENGNVFLADEWLTPDSSRYVYLSDIVVGENPDWLDKQVARDWAEEHWKENTGGKKGPVEFPEDVIDKLTRTYVDLFEKLSGKSMDDFWSL